MRQSEPKQDELYMSTPEVLGILDVAPNENSMLVDRYRPPSTSAGGWTSCGRRGSQSLGPTELVPIYALCSVVSEGQVVEQLWPSPRFWAWSSACGSWLAGSQTAAASALGGRREVLKTTLRQVVEQNSKHCMPANRR